mgnify:FL=1
MHRYDIAIVGSGPAGISAAITAKVRNKNILLLGDTSLSIKISKAQEILNYPGLPNISGADLARAFSDHLDALGIEITDKKVKTVYAMGEYFGIEAGTQMYEAASVILATGVVQTGTIKGEEEFLGRGVSYCATCDAPLYKQGNLLVIGYNKAAEAEALYLSEIAEKVSYIQMYPNESGLTESKPYRDGIIEIYREKPVEISGGFKADTLITDKGEHKFDCVFILRDSIAPDKMVPGLKLKDGHVDVSADMSTNLAGCFACGDITGRPYQYIKAAGQGNVAALSATDYLNKRKEV